MSKNRTKDLAFNTIIIGIGKFSTQIVSFLLLPLYTSILSTEEYGIYDLILTITTFALPFITLLMEESMFRFLIDCKDDTQKKNVISQTMLYTLVSTIFFLVVILVINNFFKIPYLWISLLYVASSIISGLRNALVRGLGKIKLYTLVNFISSLLNIILNIIFIALLRFGIYGLLLAGIISNIVSSAIVFIILKMHKYFSIKNYDKNLMTKMIKYSIPLVPNSLSWAVVNLSDRLVISGVIGTSANGIYAMSYKFPNLMNTIYGFFYTAWTESSAKAINDNENEEFFNKIYKTLTNAMFSVSLGIIVCMPLIFNLFIKADYSEAYKYIPILVIAMYFNNMSGYYGGIFTGYKDTKVMGTTTIIGAIINIVIDILLIKFIGIYAAAISTLVSCMVIYYYRKLNVRKYIKLQRVDLTLGCIILTISLILYYCNNNFTIKLINLLVVIIFMFFSNRKIIERVLMKLINYKQEEKKARTSNSNN